MLAKKDDKNSSERALLVLMCLIFGLSIYCVIFDNSIFGLISLSNSRNTQPILGHISVLSKDIRHKDETSFSWEDAKKGDKIRLGDRIFTGKESSAHVDLEKGGGIDLGENTMVSFAKNDGQDVANLTFGKMNVAVDGDVKVEVNGKIQTLTGKKSQIEISVDSKQRTQFRVLRGSAAVNSKAVEEKPLAAATAAAPVVVKPKTEEIVVLPKLTPRTSSQSLMYTDRMYDFYELSGKRLLIRNERRLQIQHPVNLEWDTQGFVKNVEGQISSRENFEGLTQNFVSDSDHYTSNLIYLGENYWHVKGSNVNWSTTQKFRVSSEPLQISAPRLAAGAFEYYLVGDKVQVRANIEASPQLDGFVVEYSNSPQFSKNETQVRFVDKKNITFGVSEPQEIYLRARGVNRVTEITSYSPVLKISVLQPPMPAMPQLEENNYKIFPEQALDLEWAKSQNGAAYEVELRNESNQVIETQKVTQPEHQFRIPKVGQYKIQVTAIDRFGRKSMSSTARVSVEPHLLPPAVAKRAPPPPAPARKMSSVSTISAPPPPEVLTNKNDRFSSSRIELEGGGEASLSSQALGNGEAPPDSLTMGIKAVHWLDHSGFQGFFGTKVAGLNQASSQTSPLQLEGRYLYRWSVPWNLFSNINRTQVALIGGYEFYKNSASGAFSPGYQLLKTGFGLQFPVARSWDTGGEVLVGQGFDASYQYEMSGNANYYLRSDWSVGVGYRVHLFQAGSAATAPSAGIPYREGYGEAYSVIRKHY